MTQPMDLPHRDTHTNTSKTLCRRRITWKQKMRWGSKMMSGKFKWCEIWGSGYNHRLCRYYSVLCFIYWWIMNKMCPLSNSFCRPPLWPATKHTSDWRQSTRINVIYWQQNQSGWQVRGARVWVLGADREWQMGEQVSCFLKQSGWVIRGLVREVWWWILEDRKNPFSGADKLTDSTRISKVCEHVINMSAIQQGVESWSDLKKKKRGYM